MPKNIRQGIEHDAPVQSPHRYEIVVRGPVGPTLLEAFPGLTAERRDKDTLLHGLLADPAALYGVLHLMEALGLELISLGRLG
jgi:hypothetical protein